jgi:hypothetical protein
MMRLVKIKEEGRDYNGRLREKGRRKRADKNKSRGKF